RSRRRPGLARVADRPGAARGRAGRGGHGAPPGGRPALQDPGARDPPATARAERRLSPAHPDGNARPGASGPAVELSGIRKAYREGEREHVVLDDVEVRIASGERVAILGPSGSGKSTLLNVISGIDLPDAGTVRVGEVDLTRLDERGRTIFRRER